MSPHATARLFPIRPKQGGAEVYSVVFGGKLLLKGSRDPEHDAARALVALGITGKLTLLDGKTGKPRSIIHDIELAAGFRMEGLKVRPLRGAMPGRGIAAHSPGTGEEAA